MNKILHPNAQVYVRNSPLTVLDGADSLNNLERCLTSVISDMTHLERRESLLCNSNGRVLDKLLLAAIEGRMIIVGYDGSKDQTRQILLNGMAWNEEVTVTYADEAISHLTIVGQNIGRVLVGLGIEYEELNKSNWTEFGNALLTATSSDVVEVIIPKGEVEHFIEALDFNGCSRIHEDAWQPLRMSLGILEIDDIYGNLPSEVGLDEYVVLSKGCYPGQEIHARLDSRGKASKKLVVLRSVGNFECGKTASEDIGTIRITSCCNTGTESLAFALVPIRAIELEMISLEGMQATLESINHP